jgi:hypothetical protein
MARTLKVIHTEGVDASDIRSLVETATRGCKSDREKAIALWAYITRNPYYHWCEAREAPEPCTEQGVVSDPVIAFNVYGTVICYQVCDLLANLADAAGLRARTRGVPGHKVTEVFYGGRWHLFDAQYDCAAYFVADDGKRIISLDELCLDAGKYIRKPKHPSKPFYQFDHYGGKFWPWESKEYVIKKFYPRHVSGKAGVFATYLARGHTIHLDLRRGEKLVRHFTNEGKWYCSPELFRRWRGDRTQRWVEKGPHDPRNPQHAYANGELIYQPDWAAGESNFRDGLHDGKDFVLAGGMVRPAAGKTGHVVFRVQVPYLIVGKPGQLAAAGDSSEGAVFEAEFLRRDASAANAVAVSTDNGITWREVWTNDKTGRRDVRLDLTNRVEGTYGYLVKVTLAGDAAFGKMRLRTSLFYSPVPLPAVNAGENRFAFSLDEGKGVVAVRPDLGKAPGYERFFHELKGLKYHPKYTQHLQPAAKEGHATIEVAGPPGSKIEYLTVHGSYGAPPGTSASESVEILCAAAPQGPWKSAWKSSFRERNDKWRWDDSVDIRLEKPAEKCYVKFLLKRRQWMSLNKVAIHAHYVRPARPLKPGAVTVTHAWTEDGKPKTKAVAPDLAGQTYSVKAGGKKVVNRSITIEVTNDK